MDLLLFYSLRNLVARRATSLLTVGGMALVVFVFAAVLMLADGVSRTLVDTGSPTNALVIRRSAETEVQSGVEREDAAIVGALADAAIDADGRSLLAREVVVLVALTKLDGRLANVVVRGVGAASLALRPQVRVVAGRAPGPGQAEVMVGSSIARRFPGVEVGSQLGLGTRRWRVVGVFEAGSTGFNSEVWGDVEPLMQAFQRPVYSSLIFRLRDPTTFERFKARVEGDPRLTLEAFRETEYYRKQSEFMATFLRVLGWSLTAIFSLGAVVGAMITMYAAVAHRTAEIGTLRALGFGRGTILGAFLAEAVLLGLAGAGIGLALASVLQVVSVSTMNFQTFSELAFRFTLTPATATTALLLGVGMGLAGGVLPAARAARMDLVTAVRGG
jgi:ABC-type antimicrobial peptide transport system permease subunit